MCGIISLLAYCLTLAPAAHGDDAAASAMPWIRLADDGRTFVFEGAGKRFVPWGFNYDHDEKGTLLEDYWETDWQRVVQDFQESRRRAVLAVPDALPSEGDQASDRQRTTPLVSSSSVPSPREREAASS